MLCLNLLTSNIIINNNLQLENGYTFHDYNVKLNDVIQLMVKNQPEVAENEKKVDKGTPTKDNISNDKSKNELKTYAGKIYIIFIYTSDIYNLY